MADTEDYSTHPFETSPPPGCLEVARLLNFPLSTHPFETTGGASLKRVRPSPFPPRSPPAPVPHPFDISPGIMSKVKDFRLLYWLGCFSTRWQQRGFKLRGLMMPTYHSSKVAKFQCLQVGIWRTWVTHAFVSKRAPTYLHFKCVADQS